MASAEEVKKLAGLARITVSEEELPKFIEEFEAILAYVGQLEKLELPAKTAKGGSPDAEDSASRGLRNVFREDGEPTPAGTWTEKMVEAFPQKEKNALVVKQIITHE